MEVVKRIREVGKGLPWGGLGATDEGVGVEEMGGGGRGGAWARVGEDGGGGREGGDERDVVVPGRRISEGLSHGAEKGNPVAGRGRVEAFRRRRGGRYMNTLSRDTTHQPSYLQHLLTDCP